MKQQVGIAIGVVTVVGLAANIGAQTVGTAFTFQGELIHDSTPVDDDCDFVFTLHDAPIAGMPIGNPVDQIGVPVAGGVFSVSLDFDEDVFDGHARWLGISVTCPTISGDSVPLAPRQEIRPVPYALALPALRTQQNGPDPTGPPCPGLHGPNLVGGWHGNSVDAGRVGATIGGGGGVLCFAQAIAKPNLVTDHFGTVAGGWNNQAGSYATVGGGEDNIANARSAAVAGGRNNTADGLQAAVGGGAGNEAGGDWATVPGGNANAANGIYSFAAGRRAKALHDGAFIWADDHDEDFASTSENQFRVRADGGVLFDVNQDEWILIEADAGGLFNSLILTSLGADLSMGGEWRNASSREKKEGFQAVDSQEILRRVASLPVQAWKYKVESASVRHVGPTAEDFHAAFGFGSSDKLISTVDANGVALAAIQGLHQLVQEKESELCALRAEKDAQIADLAKRLERIEALLAEHAE